MIIPIIEVIQTYLFVSCFLKRKVRFGKVLDWLVLIGVSEVGTIGNHYFQDANINILIAVIELFILLSFFDGGVKRKILAGLLYLVFAFLAEGVVAVGLSRAYDIRISDMGNQEEAVILLGKRYSREIRVIATMFFYLLSRKKRDTEKRDIQGQLLVIPALSAVLLVIVTEDQFAREQINVWMEVMLILFILIINAVLYVLFRRQEVYFREEEMIRNQLKELEYESAHYRELEQHQQEIRRIRHDIKNELSGIYGYLENGEVGEGKKEIETLLQQMTAAEQKIFTANAVVNGILNLKLQKMEMAQIEYEFDIHIPEQLKIQGTDLGVLLGNLPDNAIEACQEFQGEKKIRLLIEYQNSGVVIHCENPCNEDTETLQTKKKDKINHGFGMGSIAQIVKKYDGFWEYQMKSGLFKVTVNLWEKSEMI